MYVQLAARDGVELAARGGVELAALGGVQLIDALVCTADRILSTVYSHVY